MILWYTLCFVLLVHAQSCENYGLLNGTSCACPIGFGGSTCSQIGCGGTIFQGSKRQLTSSSTGSFANLTASSCQCASGWTGTGCNVCQTANACQTGFTAVGQPTIDSSSLDGTQGNETLVCNTQAQVYASSQMSCQVNVCVFPYLPFRAHPTATESDTSITIPTCIYPEYYANASTRIFSYTQYNILRCCWQHLRSAVLRRGRTILLRGRFVYPTAWQHKQFCKLAMLKPPVYMPTQYLVLWWRSCHQSHRCYQYSRWKSRD